MPALQHNNAFELSENSGPLRTAVIAIGTGTAKLECCSTRDPEAGTWVEVPDSLQSASTVYSFHQGRRIFYRWVLTGDASGYMSD
jgi:hypothetical protein